MESQCTAIRIATLNKVINSLWDVSAVCDAEPEAGHAHAEKEKSRRAQFLKIARLSAHTSLLCWEEQFMTTKKICSDKISKRLLTLPLGRSGQEMHGKFRARSISIDRSPPRFQLSAQRLNSSWLVGRLISLKSQFEDFSGRVSCCRNRVRSK